MRIHTVPRPISPLSPRAPLLFPRTSRSRHSPPPPPPVGEQVRSTGRTCKPDKASILQAASDLIADLKRESATADDVEHDPTPERKVESAAALPPVIATPLSVGRSGAASAGATAAIGEMGHGSTSFPVEAGAASALASHVGIVLEPWQLLPAANAPLQQEQFAAPRRGQVQDLQRVAGAEHWGSVSTSVGVFHSKQTSEPCPGPQSVDPNYVSQWLIPLEGTQTG